MLERTFLKQPANGKLYVEDVFSTYLYTGNGSTQTITNGIDLSGKGGMVWLKGRSSAVSNFLFDTTRGAGWSLTTNNGFSQSDYTGYQNFTSTGFSIGGVAYNLSGETYASWSFREAPKFFDVVTYTGTGSARTIAHNLGVAPGCIIVKAYSRNNDPWTVYHRANSSASYYEKLNTTDAQINDSTVWNGTDPTSSVFSVGTSTNTNANGVIYVAYLFAHDATTDGIIQCGSYTGNGTATGPTVSLGWEPQWLLIKNASASADWQQMDTMRGMPVGGITYPLSPNSAQAEGASGYGMDITATGFNAATGSVNANASGNTYIYIAIRRGPMKTPTSGTSVFSPQSVTLSYTGNIVVSSGTAGPIDFVLNQMQTGGAGIAQSRLNGGNYLLTAYTNAEQPGTYTNWDRMTGTKPVPWSGTSQPHAVWQFKRAPGFFDEVCYTGTGVARTLNHNLGVAPELMIVKRRDNTGAWQVYSANLANTEYLVLNTTAAKATGTTRWNSTTPTSTVLTVGTDATVNASGGTYVAYLFASCPGVSKVGSYTGNGSSQTLNCGFAAGARFVMIKRTDSTGDWYVWDTARGMVAANDPHLSLNTDVAEVTTDDSVDTDNTGFIVNQVAATNVNVNGASYIYLAVA